MTTTQATPQARRPGRGWPSGWFGVVTWLLGGLLLAFIVLPVIRLVTTSSVASLRHAAGMAAVRDAILLSLQAAAITAGIATVFGVPLAYILARGRFRGRGVIQSVVDLPLVVPHTVAGIALLFLFAGPAGSAARRRTWGCRFTGPSGASWPRCCSSACRSP